MKPARLIAVVAIGLVLVIGALVFVGTMRKSKIAEFQKDAETRLAYKHADVYYKGTDDEKKFVDGLFVSAKDAIKPSLDGFFSPPPSESKYYTALYQRMIDDAKQQGKTDLAKSLHKWVLGQNYIDVKF